jgi:hypothetical protein
MRNLMPQVNEFVQLTSCLDGLHAFPRPALGIPCIPSASRKKLSTCLLVGLLRLRSRSFCNTASLRTSSSRHPSPARNHAVISTPTKEPITARLSTSTILMPAHLPACGAGWPGSHPAPGGRCSRRSVRSPRAARRPAPSSGPPLESPHRPSADQRPVVGRRLPRLPGGLLRAAEVDWPEPPRLCRAGLSRNSVCRVRRRGLQARDLVSRRSAARGSGPAGRPRAGPGRRSGRSGRGHRSRPRRQAAWRPARSRRAFPGVGAGRAAGACGR